MLFFGGAETCFAKKKTEKAKKTTISETQSRIIAINYYGMGLAELERNNYDKAISYFEKSIKLDPDLYQAYNSLGKAYGSADRPDDAIKTLNKAISIKPDNDIAHVNLAVVYHKMRDIEKAIQECETATIINSSSISAHSVLGMLYSVISDDSKAIQQFKAAVELGDKLKKSGVTSVLNETAYFQNCFFLGQLYYKNGNFSEAIILLEKAKEGHFTDPNLYSLLGNSYIKTGNNELAIENFKYGLNFAPDEPSFLYNIACAYARKGDKPESIKWLEKAIVRYPAFKNSAKSDPDFVNIKDSEEFKKLVQ